MLKWLIGDSSMQAPARAPKKYKPEGNFLTLKKGIYERQTVQGQLPSKRANHVFAQQGPQEYEVLLL